MSINFGKDITIEDIVEQATFFDNWEEKYAFIIDLGKQLEELPDNDKTEENLIQGCQSLVWITHTKQENKLIFHSDSDAIIVKGLLAIILAAYNYKTPKEILSLDIEQYFNQLNLLEHISNVRGNGIRAMVARIQEVALTYQQ